MRRVQQNFPSMKRLRTAIPDITPAEAKAIRGLMDGSIDPLTYPSAERRDRESYHPHARYVLVLEAINEVLHGYGVECIRPREESWSGAVEYVNFGDPYIPTVMYHVPTGRYQVASWGDVVERGGKRYE